jgi:hypothetical protein
VGGGWLPDDNESVDFFIILGLTGIMTGMVTGNMTGTLTGNMTGTLTGNMTGMLTGNMTCTLTGMMLGVATGTSTGMMPVDLMPRPKSRPGQPLDIHAILRILAIRSFQAPGAVSRPKRDEKGIPCKTEAAPQLSMVMVASITDSSLGTGKMVPAVRP